MTGPAPTRVLIADDHPIFRRGLCDVLLEAGGYEIVAQVGDGEAALERCRVLRPDVALLDIEMPGPNGLEILRTLASQPESPAVVLLTMYDEYVAQAIELGARGYVLKDRAELEVVICLEQVRAGRVFVSPALADPRVSGASPGWEELTAAERRVLHLLANFKTSREIAAELGISVRTVQNHRAHAADKLGLRGANALLRFALDHRHLL